MRVLRAPVEEHWEAEGASKSEDTISRFSPWEDTSTASRESNGTES